jgi:hypothetical protein
MEHKTDVEKLRFIASWFDSQESNHPEWSGSREVQSDLRMIASRLEVMEVKKAEWLKTFWTFVICLGVTLGVFLTCSNIIKRHDAQKHYEQKSTIHQ